LSNIAFLRKIKADILKIAKDKFSVIQNC